MQKSNEWNAPVALLYPYAQGVAQVCKIHYPISLAFSLEVRDDWGFQVSPLCRHDITHSDRQIGNLVFPHVGLCHSVHLCSTNYPHLPPYLSSSLSFTSLSGIVDVAPTCGSCLPSVNYPLLDSLKDDLPSSSSCVFILYRDRIPEQK